MDLLDKKKTFTPEEHKRSIECFTLYSEGGSLKYVGEKLNMSRENVRQILIKGAKFNLYEYKTNREKHFEELLKTYTREELMLEIIDLISCEKLQKRLGVNKKDLENLLKHFNINIKVCQKSGRMEKCFNDYSRIINDLGHSPSTTEMNHKTEWRSVAARISKYWKTIEKFREAYAINRTFNNPKLINPNHLGAQNAKNL